MNFIYGITTLLVAQLITQQLPINMNVGGPYTEEQKDKAKVIMKKIYCKATRHPKQNFNELRDELSNSLQEMKLPVEIQFLPELIKDMKPYTNGDKC